MRIKRWIKRSFILGLIVAALVTAIVFIYRPAPMERTEIFKGVYLTVESVSGTLMGNGRAMIVEVHWKTPGVVVEHRQFDYEFSPDNPRTPHFNLSLLDYALSKEDASILVNTTRYRPHAVTESYPGNPVRSQETIIADGKLSHVHQHSYLLYWDDEMEVHMETTKPPSETGLKTAVLGIGLQGLQIRGGNANMNAIASPEREYDRTFIGVDPMRQVLYLMVFEKTSAYYLIQRALEAGVVFGGIVDSGGGSHLIIGDQAAAGIRAHTGIRNWRPLAGYLTIHADPL